MSSVDDLVTWLPQQLDEDERMLLSVDSTTLNTASEGVREYVERGHAEVGAKRRILDQHPKGEDGFCGDEYGLVGCKWAWPCPTVRPLALPYAARPGYRDEWRP